ncbi:MAG: dTMP kinase [Chloroflexi bacterium]|nr:dTMP kinase [Chloroflexota bacterium]
MPNGERSEPPRPYAGRFITFEGPEGAGKTTQLQLLSEWLRERGHDALTTREPGGTHIGDRIRAILLDPACTEMLSTAEVLLFSAARAQLVGQVIRPHLEGGGVVLCDRYSDSTLAYQGYGAGMDRQALRSITAFATQGLTPDLTILLDLPVAEGLRRKAAGSDEEWNRMEQKARSYHERVRQGYRQLAAADPRRWAMLDATATVETIQTAIRQRVMREIGA